MNANEIPVFEPAVSQKQADFFQHAAHDSEYAEMRGVPVDVAAGRHGATVAAGLFGKTEGCPCPKCEAGDG